MGVYVKGMEMPETCIECMNSGLRTAIRCTEWTEISAGLRENHRALSCHLTEVTEPHGDWCNECPGFEKDDCFKLKEKIRKEWTDING